jgi:hypothetical protein
VKCRKNRLGKPFGDMLVSAGVISEDDLNRALAIQANQGGDLDFLLVENEIVPLEKIQAGLSEAWV